MVTSLFLLIMQSKGINFYTISNAFNAVPLLLIFASTFGSIAGVASACIYLFIFFSGFLLAIKSRIVQWPHYLAFGITLYILGWIYRLLFLNPLMY